jgi:ABC-type Fe3+-siderophore transport system permease subunit
MKSPFFQGVTLGAIGAIAYMTLFAFIFGVSVVNDPSWNIMLWITLFYLFGSLIGVLPAMLLGGLTAVLLSRILARATHHLTPIRAIFIGVCLCLIGSLGVSILFVYFSPGTPWDNFGYLFYVGLPSSVYLVSGGWMGYSLYRMNDKERR